MIKFIKKNIEKLYLILALVYAIIIPITASLNYKYKIFPIFKFFPFFIGTISIITFIIFIIDILINKFNIIEFIRNNKTIILLGLSITFLSISCVMAVDNSISFYGRDIRFGGLLSYIFYVFLAILGCKLNPKYRNIFFRALIYITTIQCILCLIDNELTKQFLFNKISGIYFNSNHFACYLVYAITILMFNLYNNKNKYLNILDFACYIILNATLIINNTFGCYLTIIFILIVSLKLVIKNKFYIKYFFMLFLFIILSLFIKVDNNYVVKDNFKELLYDLNVVKIYTVNYKSNTEEENNNSFNDGIRFIGSYRGELWYYTIDLIKNKPLLGYGLENLEEEYLKYPMLSTNDMPHNLILYLWAAGGILTLLPYLLTHIILLIKNRKSFYINNNNTIIYFVILAHLFLSMFNNTMFYVTSLFAILFGMIYRKKDISK